MDLLFLVLTNAIGGSTYSVTKIMLEGFPERDAVFVRLGICALLFLPFVWRARRRLAALGARDWALIAGIGLAGYALPLALGNIGLKTSSSISGALLIGVEPVAIVALANLFLGERMNPLKAVSLLAGTAGALFIAFQGLPRLDGAFSAQLAGDLILAASAAAWGLYTVLGKPLLGRVDPLDLTAITSLLAFAGVSVWAVPGLSPQSWLAAGPRPWLALLYLAAIGSFVGALLWNMALKGGEASRTANFIFLQPLVGVVIGAGLMGETITRWTVAGGALVLFGMWAATRAEGAGEAA